MPLFPAADSRNRVRAIGLTLIDDPRGRSTIWLNIPAYERQVACFATYRTAYTARGKESEDYITIYKVPTANPNMLVFHEEVLFLLPSSHIQEIQYYGVDLTEVSRHGNSHLISFFPHLWKPEED